MSTIKEVARRAGVSVGTVSNVLAGLKTVSPDLRRRVDRVIRDLDYRPNQVARSLKTRQTHTLGMVISDITNPFFPELVRGAEDAAAAQGFMLATFNTDDRVGREKQVLDILRARRVDGVLLVVALPREKTAHVQMLLESGMPIVCLDRHPRGLTVDSVTVDNAGGVREAILHLVAQGARRIAYLGGQRSFYIAADRLAGYRAALREAGIPLDANLVREGDFRRESGFRMGGELLDQKPDAIFSANILMTLGVLDAMEKRGLSSPRDLLLATFDYLALMNAFHPRLTAVAQPSYRIGHEGARLLIERIQGQRSDPVQLVLPTTLEIGETTGAVQREVYRAS